MPRQCLSMPRAKILFFRRKKTYLSLFDMRPEQIRLSVLFLFIQGGNSPTGHCWASPAGVRPGGSCSFIEERSRQEDVKGSE